MGRMKEFDIRIRNGGDDAIAAVNEYTSAVEAWLKSFAALATHVIPQWIPVEEQLPEEDRLVLWFRPDKRWPVSAGRFCLPHHVDEGRDFAVPFSEGKYTHWMPLPEPPEVE